MRYVVKKGDTLSGIVRAHYGKHEDWRKVWRENRSLIKNPNLIYPGQELDLPDSLFDVGEWLRNLMKW